MSKINFVSLVLSGFVVIGITACGGAPSCDSSDVKDLLTQILKENKWVTSSANVKYQGFITESKGETKVECRVTAKYGNNEKSIAYSAYNTDDGMLYVEAMDLGF